MVEQSDLDIVIYQLREVYDDLNLYDPDYSGYSRIERLLQNLQTTIQFLEELKRRD